MENVTQPRRCPLWIKIVLSVSLAINLAIVGLAAGFILRGGPSEVRGPSMGYAMPYVLSLPRDMRREVFRTLRRDDSLPDRRARRAEYDQMIAVLRARPFDAQAAEAILLRQADGASRVQVAAQSAWLEAVSGMSPEERSAYTDRTQQVLERRAPRKKDRD